MPSILNLQSGIEALMPDAVRSRTVRTGYASPVARQARLSAGRTTQCIADTTASGALCQVPGSKQSILSIFCMYSSMALHSFHIEGPLGTSVGGGFGSNGGQKPTRRSSSIALA